MRNTITSSIFFLLSVPLLAQTPHPWEFGAGAGIGIYEGDVQSFKPYFLNTDIKPSFSAHFRRNLSNHFAASLQFAFSKSSGADRNFEPNDKRYSRGFSFEGPFTDLSLRAEIYPFGLYNAKKGTDAGLSDVRKGLSPYLAIGAGGAFFKPRVNWNGNGGVSSDLIQQDQEEALNASISIPIEIGLRVRTGKQFTLGVSAVLRYLPSDYLDGISAAGNAADSDRFFTLQAIGTYAFGKASRPSKSRRPTDAEDKIPSADSDGDGVNDDRDECPDLPGLRGMKGCPDADRDGIADASDLCPEVYGLPAMQGCPDQDEDGIADKDDNCPEIKGVAAYRGCPAVDRDKDGVADAEDLCPDMSGQLRWKGCPDSDSDGIPDNKDGCPGIAGPDHLRGCPDTDEDGIADKEDECPTIFGVAAKKGCPEAMAPAPGVPYKAIYFNSTLDDWQVTSQITLDEIVGILNADPALFARIEGHTDNTGKEPANDLLAEKRAQKCRDNLVAKGIATERLNYIGLGSKKPAVPNDTREHRQLNRRVEIHFYRK